MPADFGPKYHGHPPGFDVTLVIGGGTVTTPGKLWLGSELRAEEDAEIHDCLNVASIMDMTVDEFPWFAGRGNGYPFYDVRIDYEAYNRTFPDQHRIQFPSEFWFHYYSRAEIWLNEQLAAGRSVLVYDLEGCTGAAALVIAYAARKEQVPWKAKYDEVRKARPCIAEILPEWLQNIEFFAGPDYVNGWPHSE
jgi:hypothetical protein